MATQGMSDEERDFRKKIIDDWEAYNRMVDEWSGYAEEKRRRERRVRRHNAIVKVVGGVVAYVVGVCLIPFLVLKVRYENTVHYFKTKF